MNKISIYTVRFFFFTFVFLCLLFNFSSVCVRAQTVVDTINPGPEAGNGLGASGIGINLETNRIYIANLISDNVSVIDGSTNEIITTISVGDGPGNIVVNSITNRIYTSNFKDANVSVIDGANNQVIDTIIVGDRPERVVVNPNINRIYLFNNSGSITDSHGTISSSGTVVVIDGSNNQVIDTTVTETKISGIGINTETNRIYVSLSKSILVINGLNNQAIDTIELDFSPGSISVNSTTNLIYITNEDKVIVIDGSNNEVIFTVNLMDSVENIAVNPVTNRIYVTSDNTIRVIDGSNNEVIDSINLIGFTISEIEANSVSNHIYVIDGFSSNLSIIEGLTNQVVETVNLGISPIDLAVNTITNLIYVAEVSNKVVVIDGSSNKLIDTVKVGDIPIGIEVNPETNRIYVANKGSNDISVIDGSTNRVINTINTAEFDGEICAIVVNPETKLIYVAKCILESFEETLIREGIIIIIDGLTNEIIKIIETIPFPIAIDINSQTNQIYALSTFPLDQLTEGPDNKVTVINGNTDQVISTIDVGIGRIEPVDVTVNSVTDRIYVSDFSAIVVIDGATNQVIETIKLFGIPQKIGVNHLTNHIFVIDGFNVVDVIDGSTNTLITNIELDDFGILSGAIEVNPETNLIYVTSIEGNVTVIMDEIEPTPTPTLTPVPSIAVLTVQPTSARSSLRLKEATVAPLDQNGDPISDVIVQASVKGLGSVVTPSSATTGEDGTAKFQFRFGFVTEGGEITFKIDSLTATIKQE